MKLQIRAFAVQKTAVFISCVLLICGLPSNASAERVLRIGVAGGFYPALVSLSQRISQHIQMPVVIHIVNVVPAYQLLQQHQAPYDLMILGDLNKMQTLVQQGHVVAQSVDIIAQTDVVLWCPNRAVVKRVALKDTLAEPSVRRVAVSSVGSPVGQLVASSIQLSAHTTWVRTDNALGAWRLARAGKADCAFTVRAMMTPSDQFNAIPKRSVTLVSAIPSTSRQVSPAFSAIQLLKSPLIQARIRHLGYR